MLKASDANIWSKCPAFTDLPKAPRGNDTDARIGTAVALMAFRYGTGNKDTMEHNVKVGVTGEMRDAAYGFVEFCRTLECDKTAREVNISGGSLPKDVGDVIPDFIGYDSKNRVLHVADLKFGHSPVFAVDNMQLLLYSMGANDYFRSPEFDTVQLHIYQPRDFINGAIKTWVLGEDWGIEVSTLHRKADEAISLSAAETGSQCKFCPSRIYCPAFLESANSVLEIIHTSPEAVDMDVGKEYEYLLRAEEIVKSARKGFEDYILNRIESGEGISGWMLGRSAGRRKWSVDIETLRGMEDLLGVKLLEEKPVSIATARKDKKTREAVESLMEMSEGSKKLIRFDVDKVKEVFKY